MEFNGVFRHKCPLHEDVSLDVFNSEGLPCCTFYKTKMSGKSCDSESYIPFCLQTIHNSDKYFSKHKTLIEVK